MTSFLLNFIMGEGIDFIHNYDMYGIIECGKECSCGCERKRASLYTKL